LITSILICTAVPSSRICS